MSGSAIMVAVVGFAAAHVFTGLWLMGMHRKLVSQTELLAALLAIEKNLSDELEALRTTMNENNAKITTVFRAQDKTNQAMCQTLADHEMRIPDGEDGGCELAGENVH